MKKKVLITMLLSAATMLSASAQKFNPAPNFLKGETQINVVFDYSQVKYDGGTQDKYYKKKNAAWIEEWESKRRENNESVFIKSLNVELANVDAQTGTYPETQYTIIVTVLDCKFGSFSAGMLPARPAKLKCTMRIVKTDTTETLASVTFEESQNPFSTVGTPVDFDRMYLAFENAGKKLGKLLEKVLK
jgi:hypothetical protein